MTKHPTQQHLYFVINFCRSEFIDLRFYTHTLKSTGNSFDSMTKPEKDLNVESEEA